MQQNFSEPEFEEVQPGAFEPYPCSPEVDEEFEGIRIRAPETVYFREGNVDDLTETFARAIVCLTWQFRYHELGMAGNFADSIVFVATDAASYVPRVAMQREDNPEDEPPPEEVPTEVTPDDFADVITTGWMNPNLVDVLELPEKAGKYHVFATFGPYRSNVVTMNLEARD